MTATSLGMMAALMAVSLRFFTMRGLRVILPGETEKR
jgi:hypothetical protein